jgi:hypothetical protein
MTRAREIASQGGLVLVSKTSVGSGVTSIVVNNAFSLTYDSYQIRLTGGLTNNSGDFLLKLGATTSGYKDGMTYLNFSSTTVTGLVNTNGSSWGRFGGTYIGGYGTGYCELDGPFLAQQTYIRGMWLHQDYMGSYGGVLANTTSYTDFTLTLNTGTITGGTVYVYGYKK